MPLILPTRLYSTQGHERRVGVELEMNGLTIDALSDVVAKALNLRVTSVGRYERELDGDSAGAWGVELDFNLLKKLGREHRDKHTLSGELGDSVEEVLKRLAETLVPLEVVSPPLPMHRLGDVESLIQALRAAGAKGTSDRLVNAFGMQFNPEIPDESAETVTAYLKAFVCLYEWLYVRANINLSRQVTNYIDPYSKTYMRHVLRPEYWPDQAQLIDDYLTHNPSRNRALDMLPLFAYLDEQRVRRKVDNPLIKARPTLHYRLPDCKIDRRDWSLSIAWNDWLAVEELAADRTRLNDCCRAYQQFLADPLTRWFGDWNEQLESQWLVP